MDIHVFKFSPPVNKERQGGIVNRVKRAILDELLRLHGQIAFNAVYMDHDDDSPIIGDAQLDLDAGPWACSMEVYFTDDFTNTTSNITFKVLNGNFQALPGNEVAVLPEHADSYGVVGYISLNYTGALIVQLLVLDEPVEDDAYPSWSADPSADDLRSIWLPENETFYGTIVR